MCPGAPKDKSGTSLNTSGLVRKERLGNNTIVKKPKNLAEGFCVTSVWGTLNLLWYLSFIFPSGANLQSHPQPTPTTANTTVTSPLTLYQEAFPHLIFKLFYLFFWWGKFYFKFIPIFHLRSQEFYNTFYLEIISDLEKIARTGKKKKGNSYIFYPDSPVVNILSHFFVCLIILLPSLLSPLPPPSFYMQIRKFLLYTNIKISFNI